MKAFRWVIFATFCGCATWNGMSVREVSGNAGGAAQASPIVSPLLAAQDRIVIGYTGGISARRRYEVTRLVLERLSVLFNLLPMRVTDGLVATEDSQAASTGEFGGAVLERWPRAPWLPIQGLLITLHFQSVPSDNQFRSALRLLQQIEGVRYAEPDYYQFGSSHAVHGVGVQARCASDQSETNPNDDLAWSLIKLDRTAKGDGAVVGIVDSGIYKDSADHPHQDLPAPSGGRTYDGDSYGHGTFLAGVIGAVRANAKGVQGMAPGVALTAKGFLDVQGRGRTTDAVEKIDAAVREGAQIILLSWGTTADSQDLQDAIDRHRDVLFVAAAGNFQHDLPDVPIYPAYYSVMSNGKTNVIAVQAVNSQDGKQAKFTNRLADVAAPGDGPELDKRTCSTVLNGRYGRLAGTSVAAAYVAGEAALIVSKKMRSSVDPWPNMSEDRVMKLKKIIKDHTAACETKGCVIDVTAALNSFQ